MGQCVVYKITPECSTFHFMSVSKHARLQRLRFYLGTPDLNQQGCAKSNLWTVMSHLKRNEGRVLLSTFKLGVLPSGNFIFILCAWCLKLVTALKNGMPELRKD